MKKIVLMMLLAASMLMNSNLLMAKDSFNCSTYKYHNNMGRVLGRIIGSMPDGTHYITRKAIDEKPESFKTGKSLFFKPGEQQYFNTRQFNNSQMYHM